eukprot:11311151-Alexandrium_andersonii.AAC.1
MNEITALRETVHAMASGEQALANARSAQVAEVEHVAEHRANAEAANTNELQRELDRVEAQSEVAHARLAEQARQEVALAQTVLTNTEGQSEQVQSRAQVLERRLEVAAGLLTDNEELREQAEAKDAQRAGMHRQMGEQR